MQKEATESHFPSRILGGEKVSKSPTIMRTVYLGYSYSIHCYGTFHEWFRTRGVMLMEQRAFASKPCDCEALRAMGIKFPMNSAQKQAIGYLPPGVTA